MRGTVTPALVHERDLTIINPDMELALMFALLEYDKRRQGAHHGEASYVFFSKILWPLTIIQAGPENYIGIDRLKHFFDLQFKITDFLSPESGILSSLEQENSSHQDRLNQLSAWLEEVRSPPKHDLIIKGVIGPEILHGLVPLIKLAKDKVLSSVILEPIISTDSLIDITLKYNDALRRIEETISKWHSLQGKLKQKVEAWQRSYSTSGLIEEQEQIEKKFEELDKQILDNIWDCRSEIGYLFHWAISGQSLNLVVPYIETWISMYLAQIKLPNNTKKFLVLPPSIFSENMKSNRWVPVDAFHSSFYSMLKDKVESALETQSELTKKIETVCKDQNLFLKEDANKLITRGFGKLAEMRLIEKKYIEELQLKWKNTAQELK